LNSKPYGLLLYCVWYRRQSRKVKETPGNFVIPSGYAGGSTIFLLPPIERKREIEVSPLANPLVCPTTKFLESPAKSAFKRLILETPLYRHLLLTMSTTSPSKLNDADCEKGHVSQRPPISYATSKDEASVNRNTTIRFRAGTKNSRPVGFLL
jgi:hypothetical protein